MRRPAIPARHLALSLALTLTLAGCSGDDPADVGAAPAAAGDDTRQDSTQSETTELDSTELDTTDPEGTRSGETPADETDDADEGDDADDADAELAAYVIDPTAPPARADLAPGVIVAQHRESEGTHTYLVLSAGPDGTVVENWRFPLAVGVSADGRSYAAATLGPEAFSPDLTKVAGTVRIPMEPIGFDTQVGYFDRTGEFTTLSGRDAPESGVPQSHPAFGPDGRLWYWQRGPGQQYDLTSVAVDGTDRRVEDPGLTQPAQAFVFTQGAQPVPVYVQHAASAVSDDGDLAVYRDHTGWRHSGALAELVSAEALSPTGPSATPLSFLPGSADELLCAGPALFRCRLDLAESAYTVGEAIEPEEERWQGEAQDPRLLPDGTVAWTVVNSWREGSDDVYRVVRMDPLNGALVSTGAVVHDTLHRPPFRVVGLAE